MNGGDSITRLDGERGLTSDQVELRDKALEAAGADGPRTNRHYLGEADPRLRNEKRRKADLKRALSELERRMLDNDYAAAFEAAAKATNETAAKVDTALIEVSQKLEDLEDAAPKTEGGKAIYLLPDGRGRTKDGEVISAADMALIVTSDNLPTWEEYKTTRERFIKLTGYADEVEETRQRMHDKDKPLDKPELEDITERMKVIERAMDERPSVTAAFNPVALPLDAPPLDLAAAPIIPSR